MRSEMTSQQNISALFYVNCDQKNHSIFAMLLLRQFTNAIHFVMASQYLSGFSASKKEGLKPFESSSSCDKRWCRKNNVNIVRVEWKAFFRYFALWSHVHRHFEWRQRACNLMSIGFWMGQIMVTNDATAKCGMNTRLFSYVPCLINPWPWINERRNTMCKKRWKTRVIGIFQKVCFDCQGIHRD